jgi:hypothetical protein
MWLAFLPLLSAQGSAVLSAVTPQRTTGTRNGTLIGKVTVQLRSGYHVNSNTPNDEYLIPLRLRWNATPLQIEGVTYPKAELKNYSFSSKPVSVFTGDFEILTRFKVPPTAPLGPRVLTGKLRYQACTNSMCLPPKTLEVRLPIHIQAQ